MNKAEHDDSMGETRLVQRLHFSAMKIRKYAPQTPAALPSSKETDIARHTFYTGWECFFSPSFAALLAISCHSTLTLFVSFALRFLDICLNGKSIYRNEIKYIECRLCIMIICTVGVRYEWIDPLFRGIFSFALAPSSLMFICDSISIV